MAVPWFVPIFRLVTEARLISDRRHHFGGEMFNAPRHLLDSSGALVERQFSHVRNDLLVHGRSPMMIFCCLCTQQESPRAHKIAKKLYAVLPSDYTASFILGL
jgi:hypothetical protein